MTEEEAATKQPPLLIDQLSDARRHISELLYWMDRMKHEGVSSTDCHAFRREIKQASEFVNYHSCYGKASGT